MTDVTIQDKYVELLKRSGDIQQFAAGTTVFERGDPADCMYLVSSGTVVLSIGDRVVETVEPGGLFGEMAVIDREGRSATAIAESGCELVGIDKRRFWFLVQETPYFAEIVMRAMAARIRREDPPADD